SPRGSYWGSSPAGSWRSPRATESPRLLLVPSPEQNPQRRACEPPPSPKPVLQVADIALRDAVGEVTPEHEGRRGGPGLRCVEDPHGAALGMRRPGLRCQLADRLVHLVRRDPLLPLRLHLQNEREHPLDALACGRA